MLSVVIPAYNEADRIVHTLQETLAYLDSRHYCSEILVVSDGSTDDTCRVVTDGFSGTARVAVKALAYRPNRGKGYAVRYGMLRGSGEILMFMDADYSVPMEAVETGLACLEAGADVAIGSRGVRGASVTKSQNRLRSFSAKAYTLLQNRYLGISYADTQCGFKLFTRPAARRLFQQQRLCSVIFDPEILWLADREGFRVAQFPVIWRHQENSRIQYDSLGKCFFVFQELFRIKKLHAS